ncbi:MAG: MFS transporter [Thermomicrobiales bacterium]|nr:MFS transporter [Thermomicrobiales bacterium]
MTISANEPESGWRRIVTIAFLIQFCSMMGVSVVFAFLPLYIESLGVESENRAVFWAGVLMFSQAIMVAVASPLWGSIADRYGAKLMLIRALFVCSIVYVLISYATGVAQLIPLFLVAGVFSGINTAMNNLVAGLVPRERLGAAIGTVQTGVFTGVAIGPLLGGFLADTFSYRIGLRAAGALLLFACTMVIVFIRERPQPVASGATRPGLLDGLRETSRSRPLMLLIGIIFLVQFAQQLVTPVMPIFIRQIAGERDNIATTVGLVLALGGVGSAIGAILMGRLADRLGQRRVLRYATVGSAVSFVLQAVTWALIPLAAARTVTGMFMGGLNTSVNSNVGALAPAASRGAAFGVAGSAFSLGNALGPLLGGAMTGLLSPRAVIVGAGGALMVGRLLVTLLDRARTDEA